MACEMLVTMTILRMDKWRVTAQIRLLSTDFHIFFRQSICDNSTNADFGSRCLKKPLCRKLHAKFVVQ